MNGVLAGKSALVTGASRNLGRGIAVRLAASGALVAVNYARNQAAANEVLAEIERAGGRAFLLRCELGTPGAEERLADALTVELERRTGSAALDILVNNVGGGDYADIGATTPEVFDRIVTDNLRIPFFVTRTLLPHLRDGGRIINISSAAARLALPEVVVYSMCKAGLDMFTLILAKELGRRRITVNSVLPGFNETESNAREASDPALRAEIEALTALGRFGQPADIANVVNALAGTELAWVTGQIIEASGGFRL